MRKLGALEIKEMTNNLSKDCRHQGAHRSWSIGVSVGMMAYDLQMRMNGF